ncbi:MAG: NBR1-Ig-like domain-containing protein [Anaerolineae bacterium]|nr:NBR1-Ig-like domain-containing protein [Anaerolineae bacterium]
MMAVTLMACTTATSTPNIVAPTASASPVAPCLASTPSPRFLLVQPLPALVNAGEYALDIRLANAANAFTQALPITSGASLGPNGSLQIETSTGDIFETNVVATVPGVSQRITVTVEFDDIKTALFPDASGKCNPVSYGRTLQTRADINGRPLSLAAPAPTATPVVTETLAPTPMPSVNAAVTPLATGSVTPAPPVTPANTKCVANAVFVGDVNTPNPSTLPAQATFTKIWRVRNTGTCVWDNGYLLVPVGGNTFGLNQPAVVPNIPAGSVSDLALQMQAPDNAGTHTGTWRLRSPSGKLFGPLLRVTISVPKSAEKPPPTATPMPQPTLPRSTPPKFTPTPASRCDGVPAMGIFEAQRLNSRSNVFTLRWGPVSNADVIELDNGLGVVKTPGQRTVSISRDTTFRLMARCGANLIFREVQLTFVR